MPKKIIAILVILVILAAFGFSWLFFLNRQDNRLIASGTVEATEVVVSSKAAGRLLEVADEGTRLQSGAVLARIETSEALAQLKSAQAGAELAQSDFNRTQRLLKSGMISRQKFDRSVAALTQARSNLELARLHLSDALITAPLDATVLVKAVEVGELAGPGTPIAVLADLSEVTLKVYLPETQVGKVKLGEQVKVSVDSFPDETFSGTVSYISDKAEFTPKSIQTKDERVTQVFGVKIKIANPEQKLKPGMPADAEFPAGD